MLSQQESCCKISDAQCNLAKDERKLKILSFIFFSLTSYIDQIPLLPVITAVIIMTTSITEIVSLVPISAQSQFGEIAPV